MQDTWCFQLKPNNSTKCMKAQLCDATTQQGLPRAGDGEFVDGKFTFGPQGQK
jgi:hypothetical protein